MFKEHKEDILKLLAGAVLLAAAEIITKSAELPVWAEIAIFAVPYLIVGGEVVLRAVKNIFRGEVFDENFLMSVATIGAFVLGEYLEAVAVMLFYGIGELLNDAAVDRSRESISELMDIRPDHAWAERGGELVRVAPEDVAVGEVIVIKVGERVPLDCVIVEGSTQLDTASLTGESMPRDAGVGDEVISGSVILSGVVRAKVEKPYGESTVSRILELVENAADKKANVENFITRFARYYTPIVCGLALALAVVPPLVFGGEWNVWVQRGLIFLVVSCPCALVISVPMSFFCGLGGASKQGVLIKGSNFLEALSRADTVVFDKTGTLTSGKFTVVAVHPEKLDRDRVLELAAYAESLSDHPIARSILNEYARPIDRSRITDAKETSGHGVKAVVDGLTVVVGSSGLMNESGVQYHECHMIGTAVHIAVNGEYEGHIIIADRLKDDAIPAVNDLKALGVSRTVMLTGDAEAVAKAAANELGLDEYHAQLLPQNKVEIVEKLLDSRKEKKTLAFVGDGINDAPVLARADIGIAMGALGSDAAIEAADVVLMDDRPSKISVAMRIARGTMKIARQNIWFALGVKVLVLVLAALGIANMWLAVFADVGVAFLAILNATRCLKLK